jgi:hypothetical protein
VISSEVYLHLCTDIYEPCDTNCVNTGLCYREIRLFKTWDFCGVGGGGGLIFNHCFEISSLLSIMLILLPP